MTRMNSSFSTATSPKHPPVTLLPTTLSEVYASCDKRIHRSSSTSNMRSSNSDLVRPQTSIDAYQDLLLRQWWQTHKSPFSSASEHSDVTTPSHQAEDCSVDSHPLRLCQICLEEVDAHQTQTCLTCSGVVCNVCMRWYIEFKVMEGEVSDKKLVCPTPHCTQPLTERLVQASIAPELFAKYKTFLKNQKAGIRFCPRAGCGAILDEALFTSTRRGHCSACEHESCMRCGRDFHALPTCRRTEKRYHHWKKAHNVRSCPRCRADIEKNGGCTHMTCFHCDYSFCWSCLRSWQNHDEALCAPLSFLRSKDPRLGCWTPLRVVSKTALVAVGSVVVVAGAGLAVVVVPPVMLYHVTKGAIVKRRQEQERSLLRRHRYQWVEY